jgi:hypothetical protein
LIPIHSCLLGELLPIFFRLLAAQKFHQFGLRLAPILVSTVVGPAARLEDLVSAGPYLVFREATR